MTYGKKVSNYSNLYVNMAFNIDTPTVTTFGFDASQIAFNSSQSNARPAVFIPILLCRSINY
jgi:hypothetical protein